MGLLRYAADEARNINAASKEANRQSLVNASLAAKKALGGVTKDSIGLGDVDNTSDMDKPVSTATATALSGKMTIVPPPALTSSAGVTGEIAFDALYVYICVSTDTWKRTAWDVWI